MIHKHVGARQDQRSLSLLDPDRVSLKAIVFKLLKKINNIKKKVFTSHHEIGPRATPLLNVQTNHLCK